MANRLALQIVDIPWLRQASRAVGSPDMPAPIASKLLAGGYVERDVSQRSLTITARGKLALSRLG